MSRDQSRPNRVAYAKERNLRLPLLSDFHPKGEASRRYQVYRDDIGTSERVLFVIGGDGVIFWSDAPRRAPGAGAGTAISSWSRTRPY